MKQKNISPFKTFLLFVQKHRYLLLMISVVLIAIFFRFYNYPNRWGLGSDQARDAIIIKRSILSHQFPLIGPFSASGPFVFSSNWYLIFMLLTMVSPQALLTPWIMQSILFVGMVLVMMYLGYLAGGKPLAFVLGAFTAVSPAQIDASTNLIFSSFENIMSAFILLCLVYCIKKDKPLGYFFLAMSIGLAITIHFQAIPLVILLPLCTIMMRTTIKKIFLMIVGFCIPFIPLGIFDIKSDFFESRNLFSYFFLTNNPPQVGVRWLTYAFVFWPQILAYNIAGFPVFGYVDGIILLGTIAYAGVKRLLTKPVVICLITVGIVFLLLRYFGGQLFTSFLSFLYPFLLFLFAWINVQLIKISKPIGIIMCAGLIISSSLFSWQEISSARNDTAQEAQTLQIFLEQAYPHQKYAIYDYQYMTTSMSIPLALFIYSKNENNARGTRFGIAETQLRNVHIVDHITKPYNIFVYDLSAMTPSTLQKTQWTLVNPLAIYSSVEDWYKK